MGRVASSVDNALIESFWSTMQRELLDRHAWASRVDLDVLARSRMRVPRTIEREVVTNTLISLST
jgi:hypothetical protein